MPALRHGGKIVLWHAQRWNQAAVAMRSATKFARTITSVVKRLAGLGALQAPVPVPATACFLFAFSYSHGYLQGLVADLTEGSLSAVEHAVGGASGGVESTAMQVSVQYTYRSSTILYLYRRPLKPLRGLP